MHREDLRDSASGWTSLAVVLLLLALVGAIIVGYQLAPRESNLFDGSEGNVETGAALGIGVAVFLGSLVPILPLFAIAQTMRGVAELLPERPEPEDWDNDEIVQ